MTGPIHVLIGLASVTFLGHTTGIVPDRFSLGLVVLGSVLPGIAGNGIVCWLIPRLNVISAIIERTFLHHTASITPNGTETCKPVHIQSIGSLLAAL